MAKKKEEIVINKTELMPTNLGSMKQKESGVITTIIIIVIFALGILFLPRIMEMLSPVDTPPIPYVDPQSPSEETTPPEESKDNQTVFYDLTSDLAIEVNGFSLTDFVLDTSSSNITFKITNKVGTSNFFRNHPYYLEYYSKTEELLGRTKIIAEEVTTSLDQSYEIANVTPLSSIAKVAIKEIIENEYPAVSLNSNSNNAPELSCGNGKHNLIYTFKKNNNKYALISIEEIESVSSSIENYEESLDKYDELIASLEDVDGVEASLSPKVNGFEYNLTINLDKISESDFKKLFKEKYYYPKNTDAKIISFEMQASNYTCK